jgi:hypothetical protein
MKKIINKHIYFLLIFSMTAICILFASCKSEDIGSPVIKSVRMYNASPNDTLLSVGNPNSDTIFSRNAGSYVVIIGQNLQHALSIKFDGVAATFNNALFGQNSVVVPIPDIVFSAVDTTKLYTIEYATTTGSTTFSFKLGPLEPKISAISDVFANPGDSVYIYGSNLVLVQSFSYGGATITSFKPDVYGTSIGFVMPNPAPASGIVSVTTKRSTATFKIAAIPTITGISNLDPELGDSVYVYGAYLKTISSFSFGGATITNFTEGPRGAYVSFVAPDRPSYANGPVTITTSYGTTSTVYQVNTVDQVWDGLLADCWWGDYFGVNPWGSTVEGLTFQDKSFDGSMGTNSHYGDDQFGILISPVLAGGASTYFPLGNSNPHNGHPSNYWMPVANLTDSPANWALQFDISVTHPWQGGTLYIRTDFAGDTYVARYEPWKHIKGAFTTKGWETVMIPLSEFRSTVDQLGDGVSITHISDLLGPTGAISYNMTLKNFSNSPTATDFRVGIDNIRCVKIK